MLVNSHDISRIKKWMIGRRRPCYSILAWEVSAALVTILALGALEGFPEVLDHTMFSLEMRKAGYVLKAYRTLLFSR